MTTESPPTRRQSRYEALNADISELEIGPDVDLPVFPLPVLWGASGLYQWSNPLVLNPQPVLPVLPNLPRPDLVGSGDSAAPDDAAELEIALPFWWRREELRLDVDGRYPQMTVSGTLFAGFATRVHWIAKVRTVRGGWSGSIWYKDGTGTAMPYTNVYITAVRSWFPAQRSATVTFSGGGATTLVRKYSWSSAYYHPVEFEYDRTADSNPVFAIDTCDHPNHPASIACESLSLETVYRRAGFGVTRSAGDTPSVPKALAGGNGTWSDMEMHDAMQVYWSHFSNSPQWSMWVFWAALHDQGSSLGGIMFDDIGPNHRQGTAIFTEAFIKNPPAGDLHPTAWVKRMRFWTAAHEMGHAFNLAHSWQKAHPPSWGTPWIPLANENEARSFMNYPYNVAGGQQAFFANFPFRFSDSELLFMRHAPARFVQMGNADWFDHHGFEQAAEFSNASLRLEVRANRPEPTFEFLEPVILELKLTNIGQRPEVVSDRSLEADNLTVILARRGHRARQWSPYARYCLDAEVTVLQPGESMYKELPVFAGLNGWDISEPGTYTVQVAASTEPLNVISNPFEVRIKAPLSRDEEVIAQDIFIEDVGRTLAFGGSVHFNTANDTLQDVTGRLPERRVALHAAYALTNPRVQEFKTLTLQSSSMPESAVELGGKIVPLKAEGVEKAIQQLQVTLLADKKAAVAAETFGHIEFKQKVDMVTTALEKQGKDAAAAECQKDLHKVLKARNVLPAVLAEVERRANGKKNGR